VDVKVVIPRHLSPRQTELLRQLAQEDPAGQTTEVTPPAPEEGFFKKLWDSVKNWNNKS
jgi:DnaJ-class molecular chaperone